MTPVISALCGPCGAVKPNLPSTIAALRVYADCQTILHSCPATLPALAMTNLPKKSSIGDAHMSGLGCLPPIEFPGAPGALWARYRARQRNPKAHISVYYLTISAIDTSTTRRALRHFFLPFSTSAYLPNNGLFLNYPLCFFNCVFIWLALRAL